MGWSVATACSRLCCLADKTVRAALPAAEALVLEGAHGEGVRLDISPRRNISNGDDLSSASVLPYVAPSGRSRPSALPRSAADP